MNDLIFWLTTLLIGMHCWSTLAARIRKEVYGLKVREIK